MRGYRFSTERTHQKVLAEGDFRGENIRNDPFSIFPLVGERLPLPLLVLDTPLGFTFVGIPVNGLLPPGQKKVSGRYDEGFRFSHGRFPLEGGS